MIPVYIFYSMFGFQRTGDQLWAFGDQLGRGFLLGATAGRTTLTGEGLQHNDGHSVLLASINPACVAYDAAWAYELADHRQERPAPDVRRHPPSTRTARTSSTTSPSTTSPTSSPPSLPSTRAGRRRSNEAIVRGLYRYAGGQSRRICGQQHQS